MLLILLFTPNLFIAERRRNPLLCFMATVFQIILSLFLICVSAYFDNSSPVGMVFVFAANLFLANGNRLLVFFGGSLPKTRLFVIILLCLLSLLLDSASLWILSSS